LVAVEEAVTRNKDLHCIPPVRSVSWRADRLALAAEVAVVVAVTLYAIGPSVHPRLPDGLPHATALRRNRHFFRRRVRIPV
jgi:hypothetical protein